MAYTTINKSSDYFNTVLWAGNGSAGRNITGVGFQPDWVWVKNRSRNSNHTIVDVNRQSGTYPLSSSSSSAQDTDTNQISALISDGFTVGSSTNTNANGENLVAWNWKAGGSGSSNSDGSITSTVSANTTAGFSIVKWTGNETSGATVGHGLGAVPAVIFVKHTSAGESWCVYHKSKSNTHSLFLDTTAVANSNAKYWNNTSPTSSFFYVGNGHEVNGNGDEMIAYVFAEKKGYSKFGDYTGNGNTDGPFIYTGFKPALVIVKNTSATANWVITDNKISFNGKGSNESNVLFPSSNSGESDAYGLQMYSNGFAFKGSDSASATVNGSGNIFAYMAFAEAPLVGTNNIPATAR